MSYRSYAHVHLLVHLPLAPDRIRSSYEACEELKMTGRLLKSSFLSVYLRLICLSMRSYIVLMRVYTLRGI